MRMNNTIWVVSSCGSGHSDDWQIDCAFENEFDAIKYIEKEMGDCLPEGVEWEDFFSIQETELK